MTKEFEQKVTYKEENITRIILLAFVGFFNCLCYGLGEQGKIIGLYGILILLGFIIITLIIDSRIVRYIEVKKGGKK